ncbi:hypothetical protein ACFWPV_34650 [Streptomyces uncialis]|uniref:hypothetical protein n=1 Tax=Streptomyces uncialis TaxID=1048205 RepID=UPI0036661805
MGRLTRGGLLWGAVTWLLAAVSIWSAVFRSGGGMPRVDVAVLSGAALLCAGGRVWAARRSAAGDAARPQGVAGDPGAAVPAPPTRLPVRVPRTVRFRLVLLLVVFVPVMVIDLGARPDGDHVRLIGTIQRTGAVAAKGTITEITGLRDEAGVNKRRYYSGDVTVEVPGRDPGSVRKVKASGARLATSGSVGDEVTVLYAPDVPQLGGFVDETGNVALYTGSYARWSQSPTASGGGFLMLFTLPLALLTLFFVVFGMRQDASVRVLRADAAGGGPLPAVRARVTGAVRDEYTTVGETAGRTRTTAERSLRIECADGTRLAVRPYDVHPGGFASLASELAGRPGWLVGAARWRLVPGGQPLAFVTDDGEVLWATGNGEDFATVLGDTAVATDPGRRVRALASRTSAGLLAVQLPALGLFALSWLLVLPVLVTPSTWLLNWALCVLSPVVALVAFVRSSSAVRAAADADGGWEVTRRRDPALGP